MTRFLLRVRETFAAAARSSWVATSAALVITTALWLVGKAVGVATDDLWPLRGAVQLCGLWAFTLFAMSIVAVGRSQAWSRCSAGSTGRRAFIGLWVLRRCSLWRRTSC